MAHANARTTVYARRLIVARVLAGHRSGEVAEQRRRFVVPLQADCAMDSRGVDRANKVRQD